MPFTLLRPSWPRDAYLTSVTRVWTWEPKAGLQFEVDRRRVGPARLFHPARQVFRSAAASILGTFPARAVGLPPRPLSFSARHKLLSNNTLATLATAARSPPRRLA
jgi:hypothetical protein